MNTLNKIIIYQVIYIKEFIYINFDNYLDHKCQIKAALYSSTENNSSSPINTKRLKPLNQKTKYGTVSILESGEITMDFTGQNYIVLITLDGDYVSLF